MAVLVIAEHDNRSLKRATRQAIDAATRLGEVHLLVLGSEVQEVARAAAQVAGVGRVLVVDDAALAGQSAEAVSAQVVPLAGRYTHVLAAATAHGRDFMPRVAALLDVAQISDVIGIDSADTFRRPIYAGNAIATVQSIDPIKVLTVRGTAFDEAAAEGGRAEMEAVAVVPVEEQPELVGREAAASDRPELTAAQVVVSGGRGLGSAESFESLLTPLANALGAALGASRAAVDAGYAPNDWQVGQTGKIVAPQLYIAAGISGAIQHLAGMKDSRIIVAINKDAEAPIFEVADYGLVADLFEAIPALTARLG
ncbi:MAG: electron transfer flavoprotein subunit alpha/FixB family protein [Lautropia sp.]|nr:electron transfer flavoprotein subunit alpha/FixB family protein [Lautropia sp.]